MKQRPTRKQEQLITKTLETRFYDLSDEIAEGTVEGGRLSRSEVRENHTEMLNIAITLDQVFGLPTILRDFNNEWTEDKLQEFMPD